MVEPQKLKSVVVFLKIITTLVLSRPFGIRKPGETWIHPRNKEFVNENGKHMNKIEGHWRHLRAGL